MAYGTDEDFQQWAEAQGIALPTSPAAAVLRNRGSAYIDALYGARFVGRRASWDQDDEWPRTGAMTNIGEVVPPNAVPRQVVLASYRAAAAEAQGVDLARPFDPAGGEARVKREKVDVIETEYVAPPADAASAAPVVAGLESLLAPFIRKRRIGMLVI